MEGIEEHLKGIADLARPRVRKDLDPVDPALETEEDSVPDAPEDDPEGATEDADDEQKGVKKSSFAFTAQIAKANDEEQTVTGVVLQPEVVDGQGDIMSADVIKETAYAFLARYNQKTKLGLQHSTFPKGKMVLVESYLAPMDFVLGSKTVKAGSWIMTVKVLDKKLWAKVKDGKITGFSIGGKAKVIAAEAA